jgi:hypothetical protein
VVVLDTFPTFAGGAFWQVTDSSDPGVLRIVVPREAAENPAVTDISRSQGAHEESWTLDLDALRAHIAHTAPQSVRHFPAWASGQLNATPSRAGAARLIFEITPEMLR